MKLKYDKNIMVQEFNYFKINHKITNQLIDFIGQVIQSQQNQLIRTALAILTMNKPSTANFTCVKFAA